MVFMMSRKLMPILDENQSFTLAQALPTSEKFIWGPLLLTDMPVAGPFSNTPFNLFTKSDMGAGKLSGKFFKSIFDGTVGIAGALCAKPISGVAKTANEITAIVFLNILFPSPLKDWSFPVRGEFCKGYFWIISCI